MFITRKKSKTSIALIILSLSIASTQGLGCARRDSNYRTLSEIQQGKKSQSSFSEKFADQRREFEFLDDQTEEMLLRNRKLLIAGAFGFVVLAFLSLTKK